MIPGEHLPDPATDDSFSRYLNNERFHRALEELISKSGGDRIGVKDCQDSKACRDMVWKAGNPAWENPQNVQGEIGEASYFKFLIPTFQGQPVRQQNMYAEFVKDGFWVDLHISKVLYKPKNTSCLSGSSNLSNLSRRVRSLRGTSLIPVFLLESSTTANQIGSQNFIPPCRNSLSHALTI